jgi:hypothetical protein
MLLAALLALTGPAWAQPAQPPAPAPDPGAAQPVPGKPLVAVAGWRYEPGNRGVHFFICERASCIPGARVSYRTFGGDNPTTLAQFRSDHERVTKVLQERAAPGTKITLIGVEGDEGTELPRSFRARRTTERPDGSIEHLVTGMLIGAAGSATLISSSRDENASVANYLLFLRPLLLVLSMPGTRATQQ